MIKLIECPRDAMQGLKNFIPTDIKVSYINTLLKVGFDSIDFGSFVSPKAIPQMRDTAEVLDKLDLSSTRSKLLAIVANERGAREAATYQQIDYLGYPFSISETFQVRNTNSTIEESLHRLSEIQAICIKRGKKLVIYISMGFGNPYGDPWDIAIVEKWVSDLVSMGIEIISLSDTIGVSNEESIAYLFKNIVGRFEKVEFGAHLHTTPSTWKEKVHAAFTNGCTRFDGAIRGFGGCPMARDELTGNMPTEKMIEYFLDQNIKLDVDLDYFDHALFQSTHVFA